MLTQFNEGGSLQRTQVRHDCLLTKTRVPEQSNELCSILTVCSLTRVGAGVRYDHLLESPSGQVRHTSAQTMIGGGMARTYGDTRTLHHHRLQGVNFHIATAQWSLSSLELSRERSVEHGST
jgi:hypothetical protein